MPYQLSSFNTNGTLSRSHFGVYWNGYESRILLLLCSWLHAITLGIFLEGLWQSPFCPKLLLSLCLQSETQLLHLPFQVSLSAFLFQWLPLPSPTPHHASLTPGMLCVLLRVFPSAPYLLIPPLVILWPWHHYAAPRSSISLSFLCFFPKIYLSLLNTSNCPYLYSYVVICLNTAWVLWWTCYSATRFSHSHSYTADRVDRGQMIQLFSIYLVFIAS